MITTRNQGIDQLKLVLALMVVAIHVFRSDYAGVQGVVYYWILNGLPRIAVPVFFLLSGYFLRGKIDDAIKIWKYILGLWAIFIVWSIIYSFMWLPRALNGVLPVVKIVQFSIYGYGPLWYLFAQILGVGIAHLTQIWSQKARFIIAIGLFSIGYMLWMLDRSGILSSSKLVYAAYEWIGTSRNFLFMAFPFLTLGLIFDYWKNEINLVFKIISVFFLICEPFIYHFIGLDLADFTIFALLLSMTVFTIFESGFHLFSFSFDVNLPLGIYLIHYPIFFTVSYIDKEWLHLALNGPILYILIVVLSFIFFVPLNQLNKRTRLLFR